MIQCEARAESPGQGSRLAPGEVEEDECGEEGLLGHVKLSSLLGWAF